MIPETLYALIRLACKKRPAGGVRLPRAARDYLAAPRDEFYRSEMAALLHCCCGGLAVVPDLLPGSPRTPLWSWSVAWRSGVTEPDGDTVWPDLFPGNPGIPAPLLVLEAEPPLD